MLSGERRRLAGLESQLEHAQMQLQSGMMRILQIASPDFDAAFKERETVRDTGLLLTCLLRLLACLRLASTCCRQCPSSQHFNARAGCQHVISMVCKVSVRS